MPTSRPLPRESTEGLDLVPIRTVANLTGVNIITLRAWERRYGFVKPVRTPGGHRLYRREDIDRIHRALVLVNKGVAIGQVKHSLGAPSKPVKTSESPWPTFQAHMVSAIVRFDEEALDETYNDALALYPIEHVTDALLLPLLRELGRRWETEEGSVAEEHFFGVYLRNKLGARFHHRSRGNAGPRILAACLPGEQHEIGLLLFALAAHDRGLRPVLLGANTPLSELAIAAKSARCSAIVLAGSSGFETTTLRKDLSRLVNAAGIPVFVGGLASIRARGDIEAAGAISAGVELSLGVERIRSALPSVKPVSK